MIAPTISLTRTFSLKIIIDSGIISIGVIDVIVETIPVGACCTANKPNETPINGPKSEPIEIDLIACVSVKAEYTFFHLFVMVITSANPIIAAIILI